MPVCTMQDNFHLSLKNPLCHSILHLTLWKELSLTQKCLKMYLAASTFQTACYLKEVKNNVIKHCACLIPNVHYMNSFGQLLQREICPCSFAPNLPSGSCPKWGIRAGSVPRTWVSDSLAHTESLFFPVLSRGQMSIKNDEAKFIWKPCKMPFF